MRLNSTFFLLLRRFYEPINYTARTLVRLFVSPRGQCGGPLSYLSSANKKPNYYPDVLAMAGINLPEEIALEGRLL